MDHPIRHVLVVFDGSRAAPRALRAATAIADEHDAELSVVSVSAHDRRTTGCVNCGISIALWNEMLDAVAEGELDTARAIVGDRQRRTHFAVVPGDDARTLRRAVSELGCDLVVVPESGRLRTFARRRRARLERGLAVEVIGAGRA